MKSNKDRAGPISLYYRLIPQFQNTNRTTARSLNWQENFSWLSIKFYRTI